MNDGMDLVRQFLKENPEHCVGVSATDIDGSTFPQMDAEAWLAWLKWWSVNKDGLTEQQANAAVEKAKAFLAEHEEAEEGDEWKNGPATDDLS